MRMKRKWGRPTLGAVKRQRCRFGCPSPQQGNLGIASCSLHIPA
jgi:hypothetical protein